MSNKQQPLPKLSPTTIEVTGTYLHKKINERINHYTKSEQRCVETLVESLTKTEEDQAAISRAVFLLIAVLDNQDLSAQALAAKGQLDRAVFLRKEVRDLTHIMNNVQGDRVYELTLEEAKRFGVS